MTSNNLESFRKEIDIIDLELLEIFKKRMDISKKIGEYKDKNKMHIADEKREDIILNNLYDNRLKVLDGEINKDFIKEVWTSIMKFSKLNQIN